MGSRMRRKRRKVDRLSRSPHTPGKLVVPHGSPAPHIHVIAYGEDALVEVETDDVEKIVAMRGKHPVLWINVEGLGDAELLERLGKAFGLHRLTLEDVLHVHQRAKVELWADYVFVVVRMFSLEPQLDTEQLGIVFGKDFIITFQEGKPGDCLEPVRQRLRKKRGIIRRAGSDYLCYALLDAVTDCHFPILNAYADRLDGLEDEVLGQPYLDVIWRIHGIKRDFLTLHNTLLPQRDVVHGLMREATALVGQEARIHLRDVADHTGQILDLLASYREMAQALIEIHLNIASNQMNEVMKVLTLVAVVFIPLTFIAGVYGMNFDPDSSPYNMPELRWRWGYPATMVTMALLVVAMLFYFRRKGWLERRPKDREPPG
jgi:magnesium transporter